MMNYIHDLLTLHKGNSKAFIQDSGTKMNLSEFVYKVNITASQISHQRVAEQSRVVLIQYNDIASMHYIFAVLKLGLIAVPISSETKPFVFEHILEDCTPSLVIDTEGCEEIRKICINKSIVYIVSTEESNNSTEFRNAEELSALSLALLIYTSGSTGLPKAVVSTHQQVMFCVEAINSVLQYSNEDTVLNLLPLSFDYGLYQVFLSFYSSANIIILDSKYLNSQIIELINKKNVTIFPSVPDMTRTLTRIAIRRRVQLDHLTKLTNTGADLDIKSKENFSAIAPKCEVYSMYGVTECKRVAIERKPTRNHFKGSSGSALSGTKIDIIDGEGKILPSNTIGEIKVTGPNVMSGYWKATKEANKRFEVDRYGKRSYRTGDYGFIDLAGDLWFSGRGSDYFKVDGFRVSCAEIEAACNDIENVHLAVVVPPTPNNNFALVIQTGLNSQEIIEALQQRIESYKIPQEILVVATIPTNVNGKPDRQLIKEKMVNAHK